MNEIFNFPAGEIQVKKAYEFLIGNENNILYIPFFKPLNDWLMSIFMATEILKRSHKDLKLFIPYLPYSRQDRPTSDGSSFSLKVLGDLINLQNYSEIITFNVHSDVAYGCINNLVDFGIEDLVQDLCLVNKTLVIPDQGAYKKSHDILHKFESSILAIKFRDTSTGRLKIEHLIGDIEGKNCLIVDDICDGGATFIELAKKLKEKGADDVELYVTHGFFSKGLHVLYDAGISKIYTTNSVCLLNESNVLKIQDVRDLVT